MGESLRTHSLGFHSLRFRMSTNSKIQKVAKTERVTETASTTGILNIRKIWYGRLLGWLVEVVRATVDDCSMSHGCQSEFTVSDAYPQMVWLVQVSLRLESKVLGSDRLVDLPQYLWFNRHLSDIREQFMSKWLPILRDTRSNRFRIAVRVYTNHRFWSVWKLNCQHLQGILSETTFSCRPTPARQIKKSTLKVLGQKKSLHSGLTWGLRGQSYSNEFNGNLTHFVE